MERTYTTQMDAARKGIVTKEMEIVSRKENMEGGLFICTT